MITFSHVSAEYPASTESVISDFNFALDKGEFGLISGPSGSGKSTLVKILVGEIQPKVGSITVGPHEVSKLQRKQLPAYRQSIGVIFQDLRLLKDKTIFENVALPLELQNKFDRKQINTRVSETLERLNILSERNAHPLEISMSEQQCAAIARAVVTEPLVVIADEPTGQLDPEAAKHIFALLEHENLRGMTILALTNHLDATLARFSKTISLGQKRAMATA